MTRLSGKVAFITGGGSGIGRACAELFAQHGARVAVAGRRPEPLEQVAAAIYCRGGEAIALRCDVTEATQVARAVENAVRRFGRLDVVVNSAGRILVATAEQTTEAQWAEVMAVNLTGTFLVSRAALPHLRAAGGGSIINMGSIFSLVGRKARAAYVAAKGGVALLTKAMALDHAAEGIRINCICPAIVDTEMVRALLASYPDPEQARQERIAEIPMGRMGTPEDVAQMALFLASDESRWITGALLPVDGGFTAA